MILAGLRELMVVLAGDNDDAGKRFNEQVGQVLTENGLDVRVLELSLIHISEPTRPY